MYGVSKQSCVHTNEKDKESLRKRNKIIYLTAISLQTHLYKQLNGNNKYKSNLKKY